MSLIELAERVEKVSGPDRDVEEDIARALGWSPVPNPTHAGGLVGRWYDSNGKMSGMEGPPLFTRSLDAAMTLVPEGCLATVRHLWGGSERCGYAIVHTYCDDAEECDGKLHLDDYVSLAATPALALCAAALRARAQQEQTI